MPGQSYAPGACTTCAMHPALAAVVAWAVRRVPELPLAAMLDGSRDPDLTLLNDAVRRIDRRLDDSTPRRFVAAAKGKRSAIAYERRIRERGEIATRVRDQHDLCNALAWLMFPRTKAALNAMHVADSGVAGTRSRRRDAATLLDEFGVIVLCADPALLDLWRQHRWAELFDQRAAHVGRSMRIAVIGHGLMAALAQPFPALTAKALVLCPAPCGSADEDTTAACDVHAAGWLAAHGATFAPASLLPLPIAAWPGWDSLRRGGERFDDMNVFRPLPGHRPAPGQRAMAGARS